MHFHKVSNDFLKSRTALITGLAYYIEYLSLLNLFLDTWYGTVVPLHCDFVVLLRRNYVSYLQEKSHYRTVPYISKAEICSRAQITAIVRHPSF
jgi:hypothetical protein